MVIVGVDPVLGAGEIAAPIGGLLAEAGPKATLSRWRCPAGR
jgi:hypothetical protein